MSGRMFLLAAALTAGIAGCGAQADTDQPTIHDTMTGRIDPAAQRIWEIAAKSYGDDGTAEGGLLEQEDWQELEFAISSLHDGAIYLADNPDIRVVQDGGKILNEGEFPEAQTAAQVEGFIEADREGYASRARDLVEISDGMQQAVAGRNLVRAVELTEALDYVCENCHQRYWYPN